MIKKIPWALLFVCCFGVLFLFAQNQNMVRFGDVIVPLALILAASFLLYLLSLVAFRDYRQATVFSAVVTLLFFSYGHYHELLYPERIPWINVRFDHNFYKWSSLVLLLFMVWQFGFRKKKSVQFHKILTFFSFALLLMPLLQILNYKDQSPIAEATKTAIPDSIEEREDLPSIYYIVADAYGREDILKEIYGYDNSAFINFLEETGFYVADQSFANYAQTVLSIPAALHMNYLDSFARDMGTESDNRWPLKSLLNNNRFVEILRNYGYTTVAFDASMFEAAFYDSADHFITTAEVRINLFQNALLNSTIIRAFSNADFGQRANQYALHRQKILNAFEHIERIAQSKGRYYVHGHILSPHQPFVFDSSGNPRDPDDYYTIWKPMEDGWDPEVYKRQYAAQLHYINSKLRQLITNIIKESQYPPIIILQGDHGPCAHLLNTKGIEENNFKERMSILNAYYFPDKDYSKLYESISPVNSYRLILSQYFDRPQDLLPDRSYFSTWDKPYQFHEVTKELD